MKTIKEGDVITLTVEEQDREGASHGARRCIVARSLIRHGFEDVSVGPRDFFVGGSAVCWMLPDELIAVVDRFDSHKPIVNLPLEVTFVATVSP